MGSVPLLFIIHSGCVKEYSYERRDSVIVTDTIKPGDTAPWICPACIGRDTLLESKWSFHNWNVFFCGSIDTAIVNPERTAFTFFGPSACSVDTGMIISAFLEGIVLNKDLYNFTSQDGAFYYYDNVRQTTIFISRQTNPFSVTIDSYIHQTRMATGTFNGPIFRTNGGASYVFSGKFKVKLN